MLNENTKTKEVKMKMTKGHKRAMKRLFIVAGVIVAIGLTLAGLTWDGIIS